MAKLSDLNPNPKNPRSITEPKLKALQAALVEFGDLGGFVYNRKTKQLVGGHQRLKLFDANAPIVLEKKYNKPTKTGTVAEGFIELKGERFKYREVLWDSIREKAANIAANKGAGDWDNKLLTEWFKEIDALDFNLDLTMFDESEREKYLGKESKPGLTDDDEIPDEVKPRAQLGQIWQLGNHRLMCGDSTSLSDVERLMKGAKADMVFTDPPYGVSYSGGHNQKKRKGIENDSLEGESLTNLFQSSLQCAYGVANDHAAFYIWYANGKAVETFASFSGLSLTVRAVICWYKVKSGLGAFMSQYIPNYEPCIYAFKTGCSPQWFGPTDEKTVWELKKEQKNEFHPTQKPTALPERALTNSSKQGDVILDLFGGSGSTLIACEKTNRKCFMMELDPHYCDVIVTRWEQFTGQKAKLLNNKLATNGK
jgi:DNA modification methylase